MEPNFSEQERKVTVGFKCSPDLRIFLTNQAEQLGITLSSLIETRLLAEEVREAQLKEQSQKIKNLEERIAFYEQAPLLQNLCNTYKGQSITYTNSENQISTQTIENIQHVFTIIINAFKTNK